MTDLVQHLTENGIILADLNTQGTLSDGIEHATALGIKVLCNAIRQIDTQQTSRGQMISVGAILGVQL